VTDFILNNCLTEFHWKSLCADQFGKLSAEFSSKISWLNFSFKISWHEFQLKISWLIHFEYFLTNFIWKVYVLISVWKIDWIQFKKSHDLKLFSCKIVWLNFSSKSPDEFSFEYCLTDFIWKSWCMNFSLKIVYWISVQKNLLTEILFLNNCLTDSFGKVYVLNFSLKNCLIEFQLKNFWLNFIWYCWLIHWKSYMAEFQFGNCLTDFSSKFLWLNFIWIIAWLKFSFNKSLCTEFHLKLCDWISVQKISWLISC